MTARKLPQKSRCCKARLLYEQRYGLLIFRQVDGRKVYNTKCEACGRKGSRDGGPVPRSEA